VEDVLKIVDIETSFVLDVDADPAVVTDGADGDIAGMRDTQIGTEWMVQKRTSGICVSQSREDPRGISGLAQATGKQPFGQRRGVAVGLPVKAENPRPNRGRKQQ
jgi:hypothetical protein